MISSKQILSILESYLSTRQVRGKSIIIYKNPTSSDYQEMYRDSKKDNMMSNGLLLQTRQPFKEIRFILDGVTKIVYVWDAYLAIHEDVAKLLNINLDSQTILHGACEVYNGKPIASSYDLREFFSSIQGKNFDIDWHFIDKFLGNSFSNVIYNSMVN